MAYRDRKMSCDYVRVSPVKPSAIPPNEVLTKKCKRCNGDFEGHHSRKRCDACQLIVQKEQQGKANAGRKKKRELARSGVRSRFEFTGR